MESFQRALTTFMVEEWLSVAVLAEEVGLHRSTIYKWLSGYRPSPRALRKLTSHYGMSPREWMEKYSK